MSQEIKNKKLLLGSALAGLMVAAPGLSVSTGNFFQTAQLKVGYGLVQAAEGTSGSGGQGTSQTTQGTTIDDTTTQGDPATRGKKVRVESETQPTPPQTEKSCDKNCGSGSCCSGH